jgi:dTDP-4-dehydrorhamnose 3,5-epimerase
MPITATPTSIPDVLVIEPKVFGDDRFVQDNHSSSKKGVLRGLHYQMEQTQGKLVRVCHGAVFDVAVDLRKTSSTFGKWVGIELSAENKKQLWVPPGFAHGFLVLSETAEFLYKTTDYWHAGSEKCVVWNDSILNIQWPDIGLQAVLNPKDAAGLNWSEAPKF